MDQGHSRPTAGWRRLAAAPLLAAVLTLAAAPPAPGYQLEGRVVEHTLGNGMKILILPRHQSPIVSLYMKYIVGSVDEEAGRTGTAHLLEHMLFKGTRRLGTSDYAAEEPIMRRMDRVAARQDELERRREREGDNPVAAAEVAALEREMEELSAEQRRYIVKDEIDAIYNRNGGEDVNAFTDYDFTTYQVALPANRLELWAAVESDRMSHPVLREFWSERDVVMEERRQSYDSQPNRLLTELFLAEAFMAHPYRHPIIGWMSDIRYLTRSGTEGFFRDYYTPDNAILSVVGDVDPPAVIALLEKYFGPIPPSKARPATITREPAQRGERRSFLDGDANPMLVIGWHKPTLPHRDDYILDLASGLLSSGRTSRFYRRLVEKEKAAASVHAINGFPGARYDNLFAVIAVPLSQRDPGEVERMIYEELDRLKNEPAPAGELDKIKRQMKADFVRGLQSNGGLANTLAYFQALTGDWRYLTRYEEVIDGISPAEIMETARRYFNADNRTVAVLTRKAAAKEGK